MKITRVLLCASSIVVACVGAEFSEEEYWVELQKRDKSDTDPIQALTQIKKARQEYNENMGDFPV